MGYTQQSSSSSTIPITLGYPIRLAVNQTAVNEDADYQYRFVGVTEDSRCPSDVQCVWQGQITVVLETTRSSGISLGNFSLTLGSDNALSATNIEGYFVKLASVDPYTISTKPILPSEHVTTLIILEAGTSTSGPFIVSSPVALDSSDQRQQVITVGERIRVSAAVYSKLDAYEPFVSITEVRNAGEGITQLIAVSNGATVAIRWVTADTRWTPERAGQYEFRVFLLDRLEDPQVLSAVMKSSITVVHAEQDMNGNGSETANIVQGNNQFALGFYSRTSRDVEDGDNIFYSPWSMSTAFALVHEGARGDTAKEIRSVFGFPANNDIRRSSFEAIQDDLNANQGNYTLSTANALWVKEGYRLSDEYIRIASESYGSEVSNVDFPTEESRIQINDWVETKTNDKIKNLIPEGVLDDLTRLIITNAIYFKGTWVTQFDEENTSEEEFRVSKDKTVIVPMMNIQESFFKYAENDDLQIIELPYQGNKVSMLILLPKNQEESLQPLEDSLSTENLNSWRNSLRNQTVTVSIPKFKVETNYMLKAILAEMGMPSAFNPDLADLSGITEEERLYIQAALHKAFVEVNEEGTEAAAATAVVIGIESVQEYPIFRADHPFIFIIQDYETGNILFMGRVANPAQ